MKKWFLFLCACALLCSPLPAQIAGQVILQQKNAGAGYTIRALTPDPGRVIGFDGSGNLAVVTSGNPTWGGIGGTLSTQTDLVAALNARLAASAVSSYGLTLVDDATAADARATLGLGTLATQSGNLADYLTSAAAAGAYQPRDDDLSDIAALATTLHGRGLLTGADAAATRSALGLGTLATQSGNLADYLTTAAAAGAYQPLDDDLSDIASLATTAHGRGLLTGANATATRAALGLGTLATQSGNLADYLTTAAAAGAYQPLDDDLSDIASLATTAHGRGLLTGANAAATRAALGLGTLATQSGNLADYLTTAAAASAYQPLDPDLTDLADGTLSGSKVGSGIDAANITAGTLPITRGGTGAGNAASARSALGLAIGSQVQAWSTRLQDLTDNGYTDAVVLAWGAETADETVADGVVQFPVPVACSVVDLVLHLGTAATGSAYEVDVQKNGTSIFSTPLTIDSGETSSATAFTPYVLSGSASLAVGDILRVDVKQIGVTTAGKGPKLVLLLNR